MSNQSVLQLDILVNINGIVLIEIISYNNQPVQNHSLIDRTNPIFQQIIETQYARLHDQSDRDIIITSAPTNNSNHTYNHTIPNSKAHTGRLHRQSRHPLRRQMSDVTWDHKGYELLHNNSHNNTNIHHHNHTHPTTQYKPLSISNTHKQTKTSLYKQLLTTQHENKINDIIQRSQSVPSQSPCIDDNDDTIYHNTYQNNPHRSTSPKLSTRRLHSRTINQHNQYKNTANTNTRRLLLQVNITLNNTNSTSCNTSVMFDVYSDSDIFKQCEQFCRHLNEPQKTTALHQFVLQQIHNQQQS